MRLDVTLKGVDLALLTSPEVFSPRGVDRGTLALLSQVEFSPGDRVLDLGCGYGVVGLLAAKLLGPENVVLTDVDARAVALAKENASLNGLPGLDVRLGDGFAAVPERDFTLILSNPPYHADFAVPKAFITQGARHLAPGGRLYMVTKRREWYKRKFIAVFGGVRIREVGDYLIFMGETAVGRGQGT